MTEGSDLDLGLARLIPPDTLGLDAAVALLEWAVTGDRCILVVGDYDADGATASALAVRGLRALGAGQVDYLVPNREKHGYGLTPEIVGLAHQQTPDLLVTVDNGIGSLEGVAEARRRGIPVLVTDHHLPGAELPDAAAIVNPNLPGNAFPSKALAGVGVMFYVLVGLRQKLRDRGGWFGVHRPEPNLANFLDLVAVGTVADVVPLDRNNRILVEQGLRRMREGRLQPGLSALWRVAQRDPAQGVAADIAFGLGPRLNAAGRLTDMSLGIDCLLTDDPVAALVKAQILERLNQERREIEQGMREQADAMLLRRPASLDSNTLGLCLFDPGWHQGVVGILAGRLKDRHHRPTVVFAEADGGWLRGSARSVANVPMRDLLEGLSLQTPGLIERFGGHAMAAGLTLRREHFEAFREAFESAVHAALGGVLPSAELLSDGPLSPAELTLDTAQTVRLAGPWGQAFPEPLFDNECRVLGQRIIKDRHLKLSVAVGEGPPIEAMAFNFEETGEWPPGGADHLHLAYKLDVNHYQGSRRLQLLVEQFAPLGTKGQ
ncbi:MAG: single-stranded-DNA-specific exonuclease RecJ, partial [Pseudomonadota bacterium]